MQVIRQIQFARMYLCFILFLQIQELRAQYREEFSGKTSVFRTNGLPGWSAITGDGEPVFMQRMHNGIATLKVDATRDKRNIWYAFIHQNIWPQFNEVNLSDKGYRLHIEARLKPSHGPRRVNLYIKSTSSGDDFLREFDLAEAGKWYEISMTTTPIRHMENKPLLAQLSLMDWGNTGIYQLDVDYLKVDILPDGKTIADRGLPLLYRPPQADAAGFRTERKVNADATVDMLYPDLNLSEWTQKGNTDEAVLMVDNTKRIILQWDFSDLRGRMVTGSGQLEFYTHSLFRLMKDQKDFGEVRICEIIGGPAGWKESEINYNLLLQGMNEAAIINEQTTVDVAIAPGNGSKTVVTISQPVLQRLIDGKTFGLAIKPLGLISAALIDSNVKNGKYAVRLRFNVK